MGCARSMQVEAGKLRGKGQVDRTYLSANVRRLLVVSRGRLWPDLPRRAERVRRTDAAMQDASGFRVARVWRGLRL